MRNMIEVIGIQRFTKLMILLAINGLLAAGIYYYILPNKLSSKKEFTTIKGEVTRLRNDIDTIEERLVELKENEKQYDRLLERNFISDQDRINIRTTIDGMRQRSGVRTLTYNIAPIQYPQFDQSFALEYDLLKSSVSVNASAFLDLEVLALQSMINEEFPGQTVIEKITYERTNPITKDNLIQVGSGEIVDFMRSQLDFSWYSLSPKKDNQAGDQ